MEFWNLYFKSCFPLKTIIDSLTCKGAVISDHVQGWVILEWGKRIISENILISIFFFICFISLVIGGDANRGWYVGLNVEVLEGGGDRLHLSLQLNDCITSDFCFGSNRYSTRSCHDEWKQISRNITKL